MAIWEYCIDLYNHSYVITIAWLICSLFFFFFYIYLFCKASEINSEQRKSAFVWMCSEGINNQQPNVVCVCVHYTDNLFDVWQMLNRTVNMSIAYCVWCPIAPVNCLFGQLLQIYMQIRMLTGSRITFCFIGATHTERNAISL